MTQKVYKVFFAWQHEEEENWLNEMSAKGLQLINVGFCSYIFEMDVQVNYIYRLEMLDYHALNRKNAEYIEFLKETGAEYIGSIHRWIYIRKKTGSGNFDIYSDLDSKISHFNRIKLLIMCILFLNIPALFRSVMHFSEYITASRVPFLLFVLQIMIFSLMVWGYSSINKKLIKLRKNKQLQE